MGLWVFLQLVNWARGPMVGFHHPWWTDVTFPSWWGLRSVAWDCSTQRCHAHGPGGSDSTYSRAFCLDCPSACLATLASCCPLSVWVLDPAKYSRGWNLSSFLTGVLISYWPFTHSFKPNFFLCSDEGRLAFPFFSVRPPGRPSHL